LCCVSSAFSTASSHQWWRTSCARRPYRTLPHHLRCVRRSRSPRMSNGKTTQSHKLLHSA
jgi:hypothetical protein